MKNISKALMRSRRQSEWFHKKTKLPTKLVFDNVEDARRQAKDTIENNPDVAKAIVEYDWKQDNYVNHYLGSEDAYRGSFAVYGTFGR